MRAKPNTRNGKNVKPTNNSGGSNNSSSSKVTVKKSLKENVSVTKQPDNSLLRPPIDTSIAGLKQAVKLFETGTPEVIYLLNYECDVIYECRVCRNLFRSLANFISHKRVYCTRRFNHVQASPVVEDHTILVQDPVEDCNNVLPQRITAKQDLTSIMQASAAKYYKQVEEKLHSRDLNRCDTTVHLQPIDTSAFGVYQTVSKTNNDTLIKNQVSELNKIITTNEGVTLGPDGKIIQEGAPVVLETLTPEEHVIVDLRCSLCKLKFSSKKTLNHHTKTVHESFRMCYSCPCCKNVFTNTWSVHRHLYKVHRKTNEQVRRLRTQIQKKQVRAEKLAKRFNKKVITNKSSKEDNAAWIEQLEDDTQLQRCGGCGRRFERRAALTSHAQICHKRIAACSSVQSTKRKEEKPPPEVHDSVTISSSKHQSNPPQKPQSEKKIGIQVRMNYCKNSASSVVTRRSERHKSFEEKDDDSETQNLDSSIKDKVNQSSESVSKIKVEEFEESKEKISGVNNSISQESLSSCTNKTISKSSKLKMKRLETMCFQLRKAAAGLEVNNTNNRVVKSEMDSFIDMDKSRISECVKSEDGNESTNKSSGGVSENIDFNATQRESRVLKVPVGKKVVTKDFDKYNSSIPEQVVENEFSNVCLNSVNEDSRRTSSRLCTDSKNDDVQSETFVPPTKLSDNSEIVNSNDSEELSKSKDLSCINDNIERDSIRILTRFKVRSIFKHDNSSADSSISESSDHEELSIADESSLKENLSETHEEDDEQTSAIEKKMGQYIRYKTKQCLICLKKFKMMSHIKHHVADHLGWNSYHCLYTNCTYTTFSKNDCIKHLMKTHLKPQEKDRAFALVGQVGQLKTDNGDAGLKKVNKRKKPNSEQFHVIPVLKESISSELKECDENGVSIVSMNDDSSEIARKECVQTCKIDSSCSEQSDMEARFKQKLKKRKVSSGREKRVTPPIRKCSPDSTTELIETNSKISPVGAHFKHGKSISKLISKKSKP